MGFIALVRRGILSSFKTNFAPLHTFCVQLNGQNGETHCTSCLRWPLHCGQKSDWILANKLWKNCLWMRFLIPTESPPNKLRKVQEALSYQTWMQKWKTSAQMSSAQSSQLSKTKCVTNFSEADRWRVRIFQLNSHYFHQSIFFQV